MIAKLIAGLVSPITNYLAKRNDNKTAIIKQKVQRVMNADDKEAELALIVAGGMKYSWKDEYWTVVLSIPAIAIISPDSSVSTFTFSRPLNVYIAENF